MKEIYRKGIILAGGSGTRLYPSTQVISKQLVPIYDKPMIYYSLSTLMLSKIKDILLISTPQHISLFENLLGNGSQWGMNIQYAVQKSPDGLAQAFIIGKNFLKDDPCAMILGDNIFHGQNLTKKLDKANSLLEGASIFGYRVSDPQNYGVIEFDKKNQVIDIFEKPIKPKSNYVVTGLYFYDCHVSEIASGLKPSQRGELEITDLNRVYLRDKKLNIEIMGRGVSWLDTGTHDSLLEASTYVSTLQKRQGLFISCPEEIAFVNNWIDVNQLEKLAHSYKNNKYSQYLLDLVN